MTNGNFGAHCRGMQNVAIRLSRSSPVSQSRSCVAAAHDQKPLFRALASMLGRKQKLLTERRADHQIKSWHSANNLRLAPCAAGGDAIATRFRPALCNLTCNPRETDVVTVINLPN